MRIALVSPFDPNPLSSPSGRAHVGGVERVLAEVSRKLAERGHDVTVVCSSELGAGDRVEDGVTMRRVKRRGTLLRAPISNIARRLPDDAEIVHTPATYPLTTPAVLRKTRDEGIPSVLDFHFEPAPNSFFGRVATTAFRMVGPKTYTYADSVVVRSYAYGRTAPSLANIPEDRWRIVPNGFDPARFNTDGPRKQGDYLLFVGRLVPYKGLRVLLQALKRVEGAPPLLIAGDGPLRGELQKLARTLRVDVRFLGRVPDEELPALYRGARLTLLPSVNGQEAFGISLVESMACGTPVVASALPGVADVAQLGGLVSPPGDVNTLATRIKQALAPGALERGPPLAEKARSHYSWDAVADGFLKVYKEVLGELPAPEVELAADTILAR